MDLENIPENPRTDEEYEKCFSVFLKALDDKNDEVINALITKEGFIQKQFNSKKETCLHVVAKRGTISTLIQICKFGADVNAKNVHGETPLYHAIKHSSEMVKVLLENSAEIDTACEKGVTPLHQALLQGSPETLKLLANKALSAIDKNHPEETDLKEIVKILLTRKAELKLSEKDLPLLIFVAAKNGEKDFFNHVLNECRKILEADKAVKQQRIDKEYEMHGYDKTERRYVPSDPEEINFQGYYDRTALHYAVREQLPEVVRFLLEEKADVNCRTRDHYTPLHYAACLDNYEICEILLSFGADLDPDPSEREEPLILVCGRSEARNLLDSGDGYYYEEFHDKDLDSMNPFFSPKIMKLLLRSGCDPEPQENKMGMTPLLEACRSGNLEALKTLLEFNIKYYFSDYLGNSFLHYAAIGNSPEVVQVLLDKGFYLDVRNYRECTPLMFAAQNEGQTGVEAIEYLVDCGMDINATNDEDATALHLAAFFDLKEVVECLLELGANVKMQVSDDFEPIPYHHMCSAYVCGMGPGRETIFSFMAMKGDDLGEYVYSYVRHGIEKAVAYFQTAKLELEVLRIRMIFEESRFSFYDFLTMDLYSAVQFAKLDQVGQVFASGGYKQEFPCYGFLLEKRFKRSLTLRKYVDMAEKFLLNYGQNQLSILVVRKILSYLSSTDFRIFGRILSNR